MRRAQHAATSPNRSSLGRRLPRSCPRRPRRHLWTSTRRTPTRHPLDILVVEDDAVDQKLALRLLSRMGYEATRQIAERLPWSKRPRIVAMTANAMDGDHERCLEAGMDGCIAKPISCEDLVAALLQTSVGAHARGGHDPDAA